MRGAVIGGYRVEVRVGNRTAVLAVLDGATVAHHSSLAPFVSRLRLEGLMAGEVVLIDRATGTVVARRRLVQRHSGPPLTYG